MAPPTLTIGDALALHAAGVLFVDARGRYDYAAGHVRGAVNIPLEQFDNLRPVVASMPRDSAIVVYCDRQSCNSSLALALKLSAMGFGRVQVFYGGWLAWREAGGPQAP